MRGLGLFGRRRAAAAAQPPARQPRCGHRFLLPFGPSALGARLVASDGSGCPPLRVQLWNISERGACVALQSQAPQVLPVDAELQVVDPGSRTLHRLAVQVCWSTIQSHTSFIGLSFRSAPLPDDLFLRTYMKTSWADSVPGGAAAGLV